MATTPSEAKGQIRIWFGVGLAGLIVLFLSVFLSDSLASFQERTGLSADIVGGLIMITGLVMAGIQPGPGAAGWIRILAYVAGGYAAFFAFVRFFAALSGW